MKCPHCEAPCPDQALFCAACGRPITPPVSEQTQPDLSAQSVMSGQSSSAEPVQTPPQTDFPQQNQEQMNTWQQPPTWQQPAWQQPAWQPPAWQPPADQPVSVAKWIGIMLLLEFGGVFTCGILPLVMLCVWAFGSTQSQSLKNYARATLILTLIALVLGIVLFIIFFSLGVDFANNLPSYSYYYHF